MGKDLSVLFACLFIIMLGFGITVPVLPFYAERLAIAGGASRQAAAIHVGLLTGVYALGQLFFAPVWGRLSDRAGRRPLVLIGIGGYVVAQLLFGLATSLPLLYGARILGGILSSATLPVSAAYVADLTTEDERSRGMAWLGTATSLGFVVGPALSGVLSARDIHIRARFGHLLIDGFSIPFFAAAGLGLLTLFAAMKWLREPLAARADLRPLGASERRRAPADRPVARHLAPVLALTLLGQFALAIFEGTFALYGQAKFHYGASDVASGFVVCGLVMTAFQVGAVGFLGQRLSETSQIASGFALMGVSLAVLALASSRSVVFALVALFALGMAVVSPNLSALISKYGGSRRTGAALGVQSATNSIGQAAGPFLGGVLFAWKVNAPYILAAVLLVSAAVGVTRNAFTTRRSAGSFGPRGRRERSVQPR